jgi:hypothetical protein
MPESVEQDLTASMSAKMAAGILIQEDMQASNWKPGSERSKFHAVF